MFVVCCVLLGVRRFGACCSLFVDRWSLRVVRCVLCCLLFGGRCVLFAVS